MSDDSDNSDVFSELYPLVIASLTGEITPGQVAQLEELVCRDPQARRLYARLIYESVNLRTWAESAREHDGVIEFRIFNYPAYKARILKREPLHIFSLEYFGTKVTFELVSDGNHGTDLSLLAEDVDESYRMEMVAGWVSVLMAMKAAVDFQVDLRNHDPMRAWGNGYADN